MTHWNCTTAGAIPVLGFRLFCRREMAMLFIQNLLADLFSAKKAKMGKTFVAFCACGGANSWFMSVLRKRRWRKAAVFSGRWVGCQGSGAALPSDGFDYAPGGGNYLQGPPAVGPAARSSLASAIERPAHRVAPIGDGRHICGVDLAVENRGQGVQLGLQLRGRRL
jgi:hypothetical protein